MKKLMLLMAVLLFTAACGVGDTRGIANEKEMSAFEQAQRMLLEMQTFRAIATVSYHSNKGVNTYETVQHGRITGEYRVEVTGPTAVAGSVTAFNGQQIMQYNSRVDGRVLIQTEETPERSEIFLTTFVKNYLQSASISVSVSDMEEGVRTVLEAEVPGDHPYLALSRLWIDNTTLLPVKLIVFDQDGTERIVITYSIIEFNIELDDGLFTL